MRYYTWRETHNRIVRGVRTLQTERALRDIPSHYYEDVDDEYITFFGGGENQDNDVRAQGDFLYTISYGIMKLQEKGVDASLFNLYTNMRILEIAENHPHFYPELHISESDQIRHRAVINSWIIDNNLPDVIIIRPLPIEGSRSPRMVAITGILNYSNVVPGRNGIIQSGPQIGERVHGWGVDRGSAGTIDLNEPVRLNIQQTQYRNDMDEAISKLKVVVRECWLCGKSINYKECCGANPSMVHKEVSALWNHPNTKIPCCRCTEKLNDLVYRIDDIKEIVIKKIHNQRYSVKENFITNDKERIGDIKIKFNKNNTYLFINERQFRNLLKYKILDVPIELEDEVEEPEVENEYIYTNTTGTREFDYYENP